MDADSGAGDDLYEAQVAKVAHRRRLPRSATFVAISTAALVLTAAVSTAFVLSGRKPQAQHPPLGLPAFSGHHVLEQTFGHGDATLRFSGRPHGRFYVTCRGPAGLSVLSIQIPHCANTRPNSDITVSDTLPPTEKGPFTVVIQTTNRVSWGFEALATPAPQTRSASNP